MMRPYVHPPGVTLNIVDICSEWQMYNFKLGSFEAFGGFLGCTYTFPTRLSHRAIQHAKQAIPIVGLGNPAQI
eukprot:12431544-Karenia_brevis.AAC.2